jgi:hypothetical protein
MIILARELISGEDGLGGEGAKAVEEVLTPVQ